MSGDNEDVPSPTSSDEAVASHPRDTFAPAASPGKSSLRSYLRENGWLLLLSRLISVPPLRARDALLSRQLQAPGLRMGRSPRLLGLRHIRLGRNLHAGNDLWLEAVTSYGGQSFSPLLSIGDDCNLSDHVHIACTNRVLIGDGLLCGSRVIISDHSHGIYGAEEGIAQSSPGTRPSARPLSRRGSVHIGRDVWIGDGVAVLAGATIGDGAIIGANAVVTRSIPPNCIAAGIPARPLRQWNEASASWVAYESHERVSGQE